MIMDNAGLKEAMITFDKIFDADPNTYEGKEAETLATEIIAYEKEHAPLEITREQLAKLRSFNLKKKMRQNQEYLLKSTGMTPVERFRGD